MASSILLLGADPDAARLMASALRAQGHAVSASPYAQAALAAVGDARLVIVDLVPETLSAGEGSGAVDSAGTGAAGVCRRIRSTPGLSGLLVLAIAQTDDVEERVRLLEAGADDVMAKPIDAQELEARVEGLLLRTPHTRTAAPEPAPRLPKAETRRIIAFYSPKGGVGTTTMAVNVAAALADRGEVPVALLDMDLQWGGVAAHLNLRPRQSITDLARDVVALSDPATIRTYATEHPSGLSVFAASGRPDDLETIGAEEIARLLGGIRTAYEVAVVDAGSTLDERTLTVLEHADKIVIPVIPEIPALRALHALLEVLGELDGIADRSLFVLNHQSPRDMLTPDQIETTLRAPVALQVPYDAVVYLQAANQGHPVISSAAGSAPALRLMALAALVMDRADEVAAAPPAKRSLFGGLLRRGRSEGQTSG